MASLSVESTVRHHVPTLKYAYLVELPAISLLDGVDRAFEAWDGRLDLLPSYDAEYPTSDHRSDVFSLQDVGRLLSRKPDASGKCRSQLKGLNKTP